MFVAPAYVLSHIGNTVRHPVIGFDINFSSPIHIATHSIEWDGVPYIKAGLQASNFKIGKGGIQSGRIEFINANFAFTAIIFAELDQAIPVNGYLWWGDGPFAAGDEIKFFEGEIVRPNKVYDTISFDIATLAPQARQIPTYTPAPPDINYLPYPGQLFHWEGENYEVLY